MKRLLKTLAVLAVLCVCMAPVVTITEPSAAQQQKDLYNSSRMQKGNRQVLPTDQKFAVVVVKLAAGVNQPSDYPAIRTEMKNIPGVEEVWLMVDGKTPASIPADHTITLHVSAHPRIDPTPE